jgi:hypothetical protein
MKPEKRGHLSLEAAEQLAVEALSFMASDPETISRFLALTGIDPTMLRNAATEPGFLSGVLDYFLSDERLLVAFAAQANVPPTAIATARRVISPEDEM